MVIFLGSTHMFRKHAVRIWREELIAQARTELHYLTVVADSVQYLGDKALICALADLAIRQVDSLFDTKTVAITMLTDIWLNHASSLSQTFIDVLPSVYRKAVRTN
jgi:hypothetical protein